MSLTRAPFDEVNHIGRTPFRHMLKVLCIVGLLAFGVSVVSAVERVVSPDGNVTIDFVMQDGGSSAYKIEYFSKVLTGNVKHHLMLNIQDGYRDTGNNHMYPNLMTVEDIRGNEHMPTASNSNGIVRATSNIDVSSIPVHPVITEFLAKNRRDWRDDDGDASDWIELSNLSRDTLSLKGYALTDDPTEPAKWNLPDILLGPRQTILIWASGKNRSDPASQLHANFRLNADGEYLALTRYIGAEVIQEFSPEFPPQYTDIAYGLAFGQDLPGFLQPTTPGQLNPVVDYLGVVEEPVVFSLPGGLYTSSPGYLILSHNDPDVTIHYTTDRTIPTDTSPVYTSPIPITETTIVIAQAVRADYVPGPVDQQSYIFVNEDVFSFTSSLPVVVIDTFDTYPSENSSVTCAVAIFEPIEDQPATLSATPSFNGIAGIFIRGQSTSNYPKRPYALEIRDGTGQDLEVSLLGFPSDSDWVLNAQWNDRALVREGLAQTLWEEMGHYAVRHRPVELYINARSGGRDERGMAADYVGIYLFMEKIKRDVDRMDVMQLETYQNTEPAISGGYLFKADKRDSDDLTVTAGSDGSFIVFYPDTDKITPQQEIWLEHYLTEFSNVLNGPNYRDPDYGYAKYIDVDSWIDYHVLREFTKEVDSFHFSTYYYKDRYGKIFMGPQWDFDRAFGNSYQNVSDTWMVDPERWVSGSQRSPYPGYRGRFWLRLFSDLDFWQLYVDRWQEMMENILTVEHVNAVIDELVAEMREAVPRNFERWDVLDNASGAATTLEFATYDEHVDFVKGFIAMRLQWVALQFTPKPVFGSPPGSFSGTLELALAGPAGAQMYYTTDGTDPRSLGGLPRGVLYQGPISLSSTTCVTARALLNTDWSGPVTGLFVTTP